MKRRKLLKMLALLPVVPTAVKAVIKRQTNPLLVVADGNPIQARTAKRYVRVVRSVALGARFFGDEESAIPATVVYSLEESDAPNGPFSPCPHV